MLDKLKKLLKSTKFFVAVYAVIFLGLIVLFTWPLPYIAVVNLYLTIKAFVNLYWRFIVLVAAIYAVIFVIPFLIFALRYIFTYIRLFIACLKRGLDFKLLRVPFASLCGIREKGDILIRTPAGDYVIHFLDVKHRFGSVVSVINGKEVIITKAGLGTNLSRGGDIRFISAHRAMKKQLVYSSSGYALEDKEKKYRLPELDEKGKEIHVLMLHAKPLDVLKVIGSTKSPLSSGEKVGVVTFYYVSSFIKELNKIKK